MPAALPGPRTRWVSRGEEGGSVLLGFAGCWRRGSQRARAAEAARLPRRRRDAYFAHEFRGRGSVAGGRARGGGGAAGLEPERAGRGARGAASAGARQPRAPGRDRRADRRRDGRRRRRPAPPRRPRPPAPPPVHRANFAPGTPRAISGSPRPRLLRGRSPKAVAMGCGLNKLEKRDEKRPGNIYSTLKRPQVETKIDVAYEYRFLEFTTLSAAALPQSSAVRLASLRDLPAQLLGLYEQGFSLAALHPFVQPTHGLERTPLEHIFRAILIKKTDRSQKSDVYNEGYILELDCCSSLDHLSDQKIIPEFIKKVQEAASQGLKFVGVIPQYHSSPSPAGGSPTVPTAPTAHSSAGAGDAKSARGTPTSLEQESPGAPVGKEQSLEPGGGPAEQLSPAEGVNQARDAPDDDLSEVPAEPAPGRMEIFALFNKPQSHRPCRQYYPITIPLRVSRNGQTVSSLDANWLEHMSSHFRKGGALVNAVFYLGAGTDSLHGLTEGVFIFEAVSTEDSKTGQGYDAIVVEQWTVLEGVEVQTDYVPLLNSLAAYGWQLTCVLPTPVIKTTREGSVSTKQIVFLQRPCLPQKIKKKESKFQWRFSRDEGHGRQLRRSKGRLGTKDKRQAGETDKTTEDPFSKAGDAANCVAGPRQDERAPEQMRVPGQEVEGGRLPAAGRPGTGEAVQNGPAGHSRASVGGCAGHPDAGAEVAAAGPETAEEH